jgi:hypothetical protein
MRVHIGSHSAVKSRRLKSDDGSLFASVRQHLLPRPPYRMWYNPYNSTEASPTCTRDDNNHMWSCNASVPVAPVAVPLDTLYPLDSYNVLYPGTCFPNSNTTENSTGLLADWLDKRGVACMSWAPCWNVRCGNTTNDSTVIADFRDIIVSSADRGATAIGLDECGDLRGRWGHLPGEIPGLKKMALAAEGFRRGKNSPKRCSHSDGPLYNSLVIIDTKYTGVRQNDCNVYA